MVDEVREVKPGLYLGIGTLALRGHPSPFLLRGPYNAIDPGEARTMVDKEAVEVEAGQKASGGLGEAKVSHGRA